jgi:hypothetical protein
MITINSRETKSVPMIKVSDELVLNQKEDKPIHETTKMKQQHIHLTVPRKGCLSDEVLSNA